MKYDAPSATSRLSDEYESSSPSPSALALATRIIATADREHPADTMLRAELKSANHFVRAEAREVSRAVFAWFRWRGWIDAARSPAEQIKHALELADSFSERPESVSDASLVERAVPAWTREALEVSGAWTRAIQGGPRLWLRAKRGQGRALAEKLGNCWIPSEPPFADTLEYHGAEDLFRAPEFHAGEFEVQDIASQAVSLLCAPQPGETWWDACAGEGGKLLHLSELMQNKGLIWASDRAEWRLKNLKRRTARAKCFNYRGAFWDGGPKLPTKTKFDGVLVDAPCSGLGTWQRNPHARWTTTPDDVRELAEVQQRLLAHVAGSVKPGGKLIYSVCTLTRAETTDVVETFQKTFPDFEPLLLPSLANEKNPGLLAAAVTMTIWPQDLGGNGMFVVGWRRK